MEAIVLAGGLGTRLRKVVPDVPKPMAPVGGRPFLEILLTILSRKGFRHIVLSVGFMADVIYSHFGKCFEGIALDYAVEKKPLGTGGAVKLSLRQCTEDHVFVFNGDTFLDLDVSDVNAMWQAYRRPIIVGREVPDTSRYGRLITRDGLVHGFDEKGIVGPGLINAGCYVLSPDQLSNFESDMAFSLEADYLAYECLKRPFSVFVAHGQFIDIGVPTDYQLAQNMFLDVYPDGGFSTERH